MSEQRIKELKKLSYQKISAIASSLGITKTEDQKWQDREILETIARKEAEAITTKMAEPKPNYKKGLIVYCGVCDRPLKTNTSGVATWH